MRQTRPATPVLLYKVRKKDTVLMSTHAMDEEDFCVFYYQFMTQDKNSNAKID